MKKDEILGWSTLTVNIVGVLEMQTYMYNSCLQCCQVSSSEYPEIVSSGLGSLNI